MKKTTRINALAQKTIGPNFSLRLQAQPIGRRKPPNLQISLNFLPR